MALGRFTPSIPVVLYHGDTDTRAEIRSTRLAGKIGLTHATPTMVATDGPADAKFPVVVTSYEILMNDRKFLAHHSCARPSVCMIAPTAPLSGRWRYIIVDEGHRV